MKDPVNRTKVVVRHLPPSLTQSAFFDQIDARFYGRYNWSSFRLGKSSYKCQRCARANVNFNSPDIVFEFAEFFNGHVFVNEKGAQFKAIVEYAPSQRVPQLNAKKDGREGTISKDPEYMEFLERISKPVENLPSADIQLERREAERAGIQEAPVVTPLMEFIRKKRAAKSSNQAGGRTGTASPGNGRSGKQVSEKKKYILKANGKSSNGKDKSTYILVPQRESQVDASGKKIVNNESGNVSHDTTKKRFLLLKGKEPEVSQISVGTTQRKVDTSSVETSPPALTLKLNQRHDASGRIMRSILLNKETRQNQSSIAQMEQKLQGPISEKGKRPPRPSSARSGGQPSSNEQSLSSDYVGKKYGEEKSSVHGFGSSREKQYRRTRSRERLDRGVWTPRHSDTSHAGDEHQSNASDSYEAKRGESKNDTLQSGHNAEVTIAASSRNSSHIENGSHRYFGRRGPAHGEKDDGSSRRVGIAGYAQEKHVWVQKSASGS